MSFGKSFNGIAAFRFTAQTAITGSGEQGGQSSGAPQRVL